MTVSSKEGNENEPRDACPFAGTQQIQFPVPIGDVNAVRIGGTAGGGVDDGVHTFQGVVEAVGLQQITCRKDALRGVRTMQRT